MSEPAIMTLGEVASILRVSKSQVSKLVRGHVRGLARLPAIRLGRRILIRRDALFSWLSAHDRSSVVH